MSEMGRREGWGVDSVGGESGAGLGEDLADVADAFGQGRMQPPLARPSLEDRPHALLHFRNDKSR